MRRGKSRLVSQETLIPVLAGFAVTLCVAAAGLSSFYGAWLLRSWMPAWGPAVMGPGSAGERRWAGLLSR
jgi:hypothetical protein